MSSNPLRVLRHGAYARFWFAGMVSDTGTWMQSVALGFLVARTTGRAGASGMVAAAAFLPNAFISPFAGVLADRYDRRRIVLCGLAMQTALASILAALIATGHTATLTLSALVLAQGMTGSASQPATASLLPDLVPPDDLLPAVSLTQMTWNTGRFVGPMLAALGIATIGTTWCIVANAVSFAVLFFAIWSLRRSFPPGHRDDSGVFERLRDGARVAWTTPAIRFCMAGTLVLGYAIAPFIALTAIYAVKVRHGGAALTGSLSTSMAVGSIVTSLVLPVLATRIGGARALVVFFTIGVTGVASVAYAPSTIVAIALAPLVGVGSTGSFVSLNSVMQREAPPAHRARVLSLFLGTNGFFYGTAVLLYGRLGDRFGIQRTLTVGALTCAAVLALTRVTLRRFWVAFDGREATPGRGAGDAV